VVYIVSILKGQLLLGGRMKVDRILSYEEAVEFFDGEDIYEADEHLIGVEGSGTPLKLHRRLSPSVTKRIRFESKSGPKEPFFVSDTELDRQATRGVRELTSESATLLDRIIAATDGLPYPEGFLTVTDAMLGDLPLSGIDAAFRIPEEVPPDVAFREGNVTRVEVNRYERDREARVACIAFHGARCGICDFDFGRAYGPEFDGYIHVHHCRPLSQVGREYAVNPTEDLLPVCPNCHAIVHAGGKCRDVGEVKELVRKYCRGPSGMT
jgi:hypothetical protein